MDPALPLAIRLTLRQALAHWPQWTPAPRSAPEPMQVLTAGRSNFSVQVGDGQGSWVVRIDRISPDRLGLSRNAEWRCLERAAAAGFAPRPVYRDPDLGVLVCEYHPPDPDSREHIDQIAALLRRLHRLPAIHHSLDPIERARRYLDLAGGGSLPGTLTEAARRLAREPTTVCVCHNDLLSANRLCSRGRLIALDWEYAAMGDPLFDLAAIIEGDGLDRASAAALHAAWLERSPTAAERGRLEDQRQVYRALAELWERIPV